MRIDIMTLFPGTVNAVLHESIIGRAAKKGIVEINCVKDRAPGELCVAAVNKDVFSFQAHCGVHIVHALKPCQQKALVLSAG